MYWYGIEQTLVPSERQLSPSVPAVVLLTSDELVQQPTLPGLEDVLCHTPAARDARVCKLEIRANCLAGTLVLPHTTKAGVSLAYGYLITRSRIVLVDDTDTLQSQLKHLVKDKLYMGGIVSRCFYELLERLIVKDLHHLEEVEDKIEALEDDVLAGKLDNFSSVMTSLRKEAVSWFRFYSQMGNVAIRLRENENDIFSEDDQGLFRLLEDHICQLREESELLREYCTQLQTMFQSEIDILQNRTMKILTIVTTIFLPLSLLAGWYGMNFVGMPELSWKYGYPTIITISLLIVITSLSICKRKKFW